MVRPNDSELRVLGALWEMGDAPASKIADSLQKEPGWNKNTTYTLLTRLIDKGLVSRTDPGFRCRPLVSREQVQQAEAEQFVDKLFGGSAASLFAALAGGKRLPQKEINKLQQLIDEMK